MKPRRYHSLALWLLALGVTAQFAWYGAPAFYQGRVWNASEGQLVVVLCALVANAYRQPSMVMVCALVAAWHVMSAGCSLAWVWYPFIVQEGQAQCSAALDAPLGAISGFVAICLAWRIYEGRKGKNDGC